MNLGTDAGRFRPAEDPPSLVGREVSVVDEDIAEGRKPLFRNRVDHLLGHEVNIRIGASFELGRNRMGSQEGRDDVDAGHSARLRRGP